MPEQEPKSVNPSTSRSGSTSPAAPERPVPGAPPEAATPEVAAGVTPNQGLEGTEAERVRAEAQNVAAAQLREQKTREQREAEARALNRQRELDAATLVGDQEPPNKVGGGGVEVQYLGTSDEFDFGPASDEDERHVVAQAGGATVEIPRDLYDRVKVLPYDQFTEVES